jgi:Glucose-6-phosphate dehydrogenase, NAD binding domain
MCAVTTPSSKGAGTASKALRCRQPQPATLVIFGAGGDLTKRLVVPALYHLVQAGKLPDQFAVVGVDRNDQTTAQWRQNLTNMMQTLTPAGEIATPAWSWLTDRMHYACGFHAVGNLQASRATAGSATRAEQYRQCPVLLSGRRAERAIALLSSWVSDVMESPLYTPIARDNFQTVTARLR